MTFPLTGTQHLPIPSSLFYLPLCTQDHAFASNLLKITYVSFIRKYQRHNGGGIFQTSIKVTFLANKYLLPYTSPEQWWLRESSSLWSCLGTAELFILLWSIPHCSIPFLSTQKSNQIQGSMLHLHFFSGWFSSSHPSPWVFQTTEYIKCKLFCLKQAECQEQGPLANPLVTPR